MKKQIYAFTLVEVMISLTILSLIFASVMSVFLSYSRLGGKVEANRLLQSNIKVIMEHINEDIRLNGIRFDETGDGHSILPEKSYDTQHNDILYIGEGSYYLAKQTASGLLKVSADNFEEECGPVDREHNCTLVKNYADEIIPLSNSWVSFKSIEFNVSKDYIPKVSMNFEIQIAGGKGIHTNLIKESSMKIQATISENLLDTD